MGISADITGVQTMNRKDDQQFRYFADVKYRGALDPVVQAYSAPKMDFILRTISPPQDSTILDLGCGNGVFTHLWTRISDSVVGLDFSRHLLSQNPYGRPVCGDVSHLPFPDGSFDVVFEANLLHHVPDRESAVAAMKRVSRKYVVFVEPNCLNPVMFLFSLAVPAERGGLRSSLKALRALAERSGLNCLAAMSCGMISQNNTPSFLVPLLRRFDREIWWGEYIVLIAEK